MPGKFDMSDYVPVNERVDAFMKVYPEGSLQSEIVELTASRVTVKAFAYRTPSDPRPGIGHSSLEIPGATPYTRGSEIENAETSAWGRAIAALGFEVKRGIASVEEVRNKSRATPDPRQRMLDTAVAHGIDAAALEQLARQVGVPTGTHATPAQIEQIIALIETPAQVPDAVPSSDPASANEPASEDGHPPSEAGRDEQEQAGIAATATTPVGPVAGVSPPLAAGPSLEDVLKVTGGEEVPPKPDYVQRAEARAAAAKATPKGARETPEPATVGMELA